MEDFRQIGVIADVHGDQRREVERARREANLLRQPRQLRLNLRRIIVSLTVVLLGMIAWWGQ